MFTALNTALSGLAAVGTAVDIVGNNLANLNTVGYKANSVSFQDLMDQQLGVGSSPSSSIGMGVSAAQTVRHFTQGSLQQTTGAFDAAIQGQGFFVVRDNNNQQLFTRAGDFTLDSTGHLLTSTGQFVQGWTAAGGTLNVNGAPSDIVIPINGVNSAKATTTLSMSVNLDASGSVATAADPAAVPPVAAVAGATYAAPIQVVDSLGETHTLTATFTKSAANKWTYSVDIPAADLATGGTTQVATGTLSFDANGKLTSTTPVDIKIAGLANGASDQTVSWSLADTGGTGLITQFAQKSGVAATNQDGVLAGQITSIGLADGGTIVAHYSSGQQQTVGQLALASIANPESLVSAGDNNLASTPGTSQAALGVAGSGGRGAVMAGELETSTVDIAKEFTNLITYQRSYTANSKVITTGDEMLQDLMSLKR